MRMIKEGVQFDREKLCKNREDPRAFLPIRWIVERTFSWLGQNIPLSPPTPPNPSPPPASPPPTAPPSTPPRRMSKDYERLPESAEAFI